MDSSITSESVLNVRRRDAIFLFDVDGTLTKPRQVIDPAFYSFLMTVVKPKILLGLVGGSDLEKILEQMGKQALNDFDYVFSENGLVAYENGKLIASESIQRHHGEDNLQKIINFALNYMSKLVLPVKRGTFIEFRKGLINVCPVGRSCSQAEREQFFAYDKEHNIRKQFVEDINKEFPDSGLKFVIGGQISFDVFPEGWDKTYCLRFLKDIPIIHFFGDKIYPGENDHEIYADERTIGHGVTDPDSTKTILLDLLKNI